MRKNNKKNGSQQLEVAVGAISPKKPHARRNPPTPKIWRAKLFPPKPWARPDPATQKNSGRNYNSVLRHMELVGAHQG